MKKSYRRKVVYLATEFKYVKVLIAKNEPKITTQVRLG